MAFYYVKSGGSAAGADIDTADGIYSTAKTGTWASAFSAASEYFDTLGDAVVAAYGVPGDGDVIMFSDVSSNSYDNGTGIQVNQGGGSDTAGLILVSVDDDAVNTYSPGAIERLSDTADDFTFHGNGLIAGVDFGTGDDAFQEGTMRNWRVQDGTVYITGASDTAFKLNQESGRVLLRNVDVDSADAGALLFEANGAGNKFEWNGGALTGTALTALASANTFGANGGFTAEFNGVDLSNYSGALYWEGTTSANVDNVLYRYTGCKLHASATLGTIAGPLGRLEVFGGWGGVQHGFAVKDWTGQAENDDSVYVTNDAAWYEGSTVSSIKIVTTSDCSHVHPFIIDLPAQYVDIADTSKDVLSLECVSATSALQKNDVAAFLHYPDSASVVTPNWVTSGKTVGTGNYGIDPLSTSGSALDTGDLGAGDWTGEPGSPTFYKLELDTTVDAGEAGVLVIRIEVYKPSLTIYISPQIRAA